MKQKATVIKFNYGLNNKTDTMSLDEKFLYEAKNVLISDSGRITNCLGTSLVKTGAYHGAFVNKISKRMYLADNGILKEVLEPSNDTTYTNIKTLSNKDTVHFCEINDWTVYSNGTDYGLINKQYIDPLQWDMPGQATLSGLKGSFPVGLFQVLYTTNLPNGMETGCQNIAEIELTNPDGNSISINDLPDNANVYVCYPNSTVFGYAGTYSGSVTLQGNYDSLGVELSTFNKSPIPMGTTAMEYWKGSLYCYLYDEAEDKTAIFWSDPLQIHLFDLSKNFIVVNSKVVQLTSVSTALIIGTYKAIYSFDGVALMEIANFGAIKGRNAIKDTIANGSDNVLIWTELGLCSALPFRLLTDNQLSVDSGINASGAIIEKNGLKHYIVSIKNGAKPYNQRTGE